jgi:hypothetical protein
VEKYVYSYLKTILHLQKLRWILLSPLMEPNIPGSEENDLHKKKAYSWFSSEIRDYRNRIEGKLQQAFANWQLKKS